jgi:hypothetical protein
MWVLSETNETGPEQPPTGHDRQARRQLSRQEKDLLRRIDPGGRAVFVTAVMVVIVLTWILPWVGDAVGWKVLTGEADPALNVGLLPRLFAINSTVAGLGLGALALATRRWAMAWIAAMACVVVSFEGIVAIWSRQTAPHGGPGIGLVLAVISMFVLAAQWLRIVWSRP